MGERGNSLRRTCVVEESLSGIPRRHAYIRRQEASHQLKADAQGSAIRPHLAAGTQSMGGPRFIGCEVEARCRRNGVVDRAMTIIPNGKAIGCSIVLSLFFIQWRRRGD